MNTCILSPLEEALIRVVKKFNCDCDKSDCPSLFSKSNGVNSCIVFVYGEEMRENFKIESHLKRVRWYWQEIEVPDESYVVDAPHKREEVKHLVIVKSDKRLRTL